MTVPALFAGLRIGYYPGSRSFQAPSDRRRFVRYARSRGLNFELADPGREYDLVVLNQRADLSVWSRYRPGRARIVYDAIDSYISADGRDWKTLLRGTSKFITRQSRYWQPDYRKAVRQMCQRADAVVCSTEEQREVIARFCPNVHIILDVHEGEVQTVKRSYETGDTLHVIWEGLASSGIPMEMMRDLLTPIAARRTVALHLVTDLVYHLYHDRFIRCHTVNEVSRRFGDLAGRVFVHQWHPFVLSQLGAAADLAIIPIDLTNPFHRGKPENKLLVFWRMGLPTIVSVTPAYRRAMALADLDMACADSAAWHTCLDRIVEDIGYREAAGRAGLQVARQHYSETRMLERWDRVFASILDQAPNNPEASEQECTLTQDC